MADSRRAAERRCWRGWMRASATNRIWRATGHPFRLCIAQAADPHLRGACMLAQVPPPHLANPAPCHCRCRLLTCLSRVLCPSPRQPRRCGGWRAALGRRHLHRATLLASGARPRLHLLYVASAAARRRAAERAALGRAVLFASRAPRGVGLPRPASRGARQGAPRASNSPFPRTPARVAHFCSFSRD